MATAAPEALAERATKATKLVTAAQRKAKKVGADETINRSTRVRHAMKVKADAFDEITEVLAGRA